MMTRLTAAARLRMLFLLLAATGLALLTAGSCGPMISVMPTCPAELRIGESGPVKANEVNPGAIPLYEWDVEPTNAGRFGDATLNETTFEARAEGTARLRLRAADGLYEVTAYCEVRIAGAVELAVSLSASTMNPMTGETVTLTCESLGTTAATELTIRQTSGPRIRLTEVSAGVVTLVPLIAGAPVFECVGTSAAGADSEPSTLTLTVTDADGGDNGNDNDGGGRR